MEKLEIRSLRKPLELRAEGEQSPKLVGYAATFNQRTEDVGGWVEVILPGAFAASLADGHDILALVGHKTGKILGRTSAGNVSLAEDATGLLAVIDPPATSYANDLLESVRRRDITGMSIGFIVPEGGDRFYVADDGVLVREISRIDLVEVSCTPIPAQPATTLEVRERAAAAVPKKSSSENLAKARLKILINC